MNKHRTSENRSWKLLKRRWLAVKLNGMMRASRSSSDELKCRHTSMSSKRKRLRDNGASKLNCKRSMKRSTGAASNLNDAAQRVDQMRGDLLRIQRETLEMRLATEELWIQMSSVAPAAVLTQSLARLRAQLAENYRLQAAEVETQRREAEQLTAAVAKQHQQLLAQKQEWQQSAGAEQRQIELQAARLAAREEEFNRQQEREYHAQQELETDRRRLELENRRLQAELRRQHIEGTVKV